jgi:hypothetical protein
VKKWLAIAALAFMAAGCAKTQTGPAKQIDVRVEPGVISYGIAATVLAKAEGGAALKWMKGTVEFPGYDNIPDVKLQFDKDKQVWTRLFPPVPPFIQIRPGYYTVKVWGKGKQGGTYEGSTKVEFQTAKK